MSIIQAIWHIIQLLTGYNLVLPVVLYAVWKFRAKAEVRSFPAPTGSYPADYAVIVTAYEQTDALVPAVESLLRMNYTNFLVYVVADKCDVSRLRFHDERVILLRPEETLASNTRSHFHAIRHFRRPHDRITIIDSDNLADPDYLRNLNSWFDKGFHAVQGRRKAKNLDTTISRLDAARDIYYHFFDAKIMAGLGSSATLAGSGMAFSTWLYKECLEQLPVSGAGFDKVLQYEIVRRNHRIACCENAIVYDEKTSRPDQLVNQRSRWINTWFRYFGFGFRLLAGGIKHRSFNQFLFGLILLRPPLFLFILLSLLFMLTDLFIAPATALVWMAAFVVFIAGFFIALKNSHADKVIYQSLVSIPRFIALQLISLSKARKANQRSVATRHYHTNQVNEIKKNTDES